MQNKDDNKILELELKSKNYHIDNLPKHITEFVNAQAKDTTKNNYTNGLTKFYNFLIDNDTEELNQANINQTIKGYRKYLQSTKKLASTTIDNYTEIVKTFTSNYLDLTVKKLRNLNTGKTKKIKYLELNEVKGLVNTVQYTTNNPELITRDKAIICTLFGAGLRVSELITTELINYNPDDSTKEYLQQRRANKRKCKYLFCSYTDKQLTRQAINKNIKKIANEYDTRNNKNIAPKVSSHSFRHSISRYLLIDKGIPISKVKDYLRHTNIETTSKYLENTNEETQELRKSIIF